LKNLQWLHQKARAFAGSVGGVSVFSMDSIDGSKRIGTMNSHHGLKRAAQSAALRRKADRLHVLRDRIDRNASNHASEKHALLSIQIVTLHETARQLLLPMAGHRAAESRIDADR
jgi:hypothetical protein